MKMKSTVIFLVCVVVLAIFAFLFVPKLFDHETNETVTSSDTASVSSEVPKIYTLAEMIAESDNVVTGKVIKSDVDENGVMYTMTLTWRDVYKGRNYTSMGYAYVKGKQTLEINSTYLFIGDTGDAKYHYYEPFENAPWVFKVNDDGTLIHVSNGDISLLQNIDEMNLTNVKELCEKEKTSSK